MNINLFNIDINFTIKIIYKKKTNASLHKSKMSTDVTNRCQQKMETKVVKNILKKLFFMKMTNVIPFLPVSERKKYEKLDK